MFCTKKNDKISAARARPTMKEALETIHNTIVLLWESGDKVFKVMQHTSKLHPENRDVLVQFFSPMVQYIVEIALAGHHPDREVLQEASAAFMAALSDADNSNNMESAVKAGDFFRQCSALVRFSIHAHQCEIMNKINLNATKYNAPDFSWLALGLLDEHNQAHNKFIKPSVKSRARFVRTCTREGLSTRHRPTPWMQLHKLFQKNSPAQN